LSDKREGAPFSWWLTAGRELARRLDADNRRRRGKPDWEHLNLLACDEDNLGVVLGAMSLTERVAVLPRDAWPDRKADHDIWMMRLPGHDIMVAVDSGSGAWRHGRLENGTDLISLGAWRWNLRWGQAAWRIARVLGLRELPHVR